MSEIMKKRLLPLREVDVIITLNSNATKELVDIVGVQPSRIHETTIPIEINDRTKYDVKALRRKMGASQSDRILATVGFLSEKKGIKAAIRAMSFLPPNYKLAILGGVNPVSGNHQVYDDICDEIITLQLQDRVYISGYVGSDYDLDTLVSGADIALYPYDPEYYKLASSAAINTAINNYVPIVAYPAQSFIELERRVPGCIAITNSPNYYELVRAVEALDVEAQRAQMGTYAEKYSLKNIADSLVAIYTGLITG